MFCTTTVCPIYPDAQCVIYSGANLPCSGIKTNDRLNAIIGKLDAKICSVASFGLVTLSNIGIALTGTGVTGSPLEATIHIDNVTPGNIIGLNADGLYASVTALSLDIVGATPNAFGATLSNSVLNLQPANYTYSGALTNLAQQIGGAKDFNETITIHKTAIVGREYVMRAYISDAGNDQFFIANSTSVINRFHSMFGAYQDTVSDTSPLALRCMTNIANDNAGAEAMIALVANLTSSPTDPLNGTYTDIVNKDILSVANGGTRHMLIKANGVVQFPHYLNDVSETSVLSTDVSGNVKLKTISSVSPTLTSGNIYVGNGSNIATSVTPTGDVTITNAGVTAIASGVIVNADINSSAAIAYSKLSLGTSIVNADISTSAAIAYSKLTLTGAILNADLAGSIAYSKLSLTGTILNADLAGSIIASKLVGSDITTVGTLTAGATGAGFTVALGTSTITGTIPTANTDALTGNVTKSVGSSVTTIAAGVVTNTMLAGSIAYSKLSLTGAILNADLAGSIAYSKLSLTGTIVNADISTSAAIIYSKLSLGTSILNSDISASAAIAYSKLNLTGAILNADLAGSIAYSKLSLTGAILNADLAGSIAYSKLSLTGAIVNGDLAGSIAASKLVGTDIVTVGTITSGTWHGAVIADTYISSAITWNAKAPLASPTFTGTVTIPTPFTLGAVSVTTTGTQLNYLNTATGTTGTNTTNLVYSTSPTLVTPVLGVATATTINKITLTTPATGSTITIADGKTIVQNNSITYTGTDATTMTFPTTSTTLVGIDTTQTLTNKSIVATQLTGTLQAAQAPAFTGDVTSSAGALALTIASAVVGVSKMTMSAHTIAANNTSSTAAPTELVYINAGIQTLTGSPTWDSTPPSTPGTLQYHYIQLGKHCQIWVWLTYTVAGTTNTSVDIPWQADMALPEEPASRTGTNNVIAVGVGAMPSGVTSTAVTIKEACIKKTGTGTYKMNVNAASVSAVGADLYISYVCV